MPRPKSKAELLNLSEANYTKLITFIESMDLKEQAKTFPKGTMNRNIRDVLAHLHHWHLMMIGWYNIGMAGEKPVMPAEGYTWKTLPDFNKKVFEKYKTVELDQAKKMVQKSYRQVRQLIESNDDDSLFTKKKYKWTGSTSLGAYLISNTSSHYDWAYKLIKKAKK